MDLVQRQLFFSKHLLDWYRLYKRDLPWRRSRNPYYIWVSEIMLQQTRVDTVIPYFHRFIDKFPTVEALADAPEEEVLKAWEGLGYYSRARNLQTAVRKVKEVYNGIVPSSKEEISSLKGVGPYTAGAILSIAYDLPEPAVDGNVMRVLSRYFLIEEDIMKNSTRVSMEKLIYQLIPEGAAADFNQALMELGALVCTPKSPHCLTCPVMEHCAGRIAGMEEALPIKKKAKPPRPENRVVAFIMGSGEQTGKFLIRQRAAEGLLARMWELPHALSPEPGYVLRKDDVFNMNLLSNCFYSETGLDVQPQDWYMQVDHVFSHIIWNMDVFTCKLSSDSKQSLPEAYRWVDLNDLVHYPLPNVFNRILKQYTAQ